MTDLNHHHSPAAVTGSTSHSHTSDLSQKDDVVSTHVLVSEDQIEKLRELSRRTRIAQSEYLREAVEDLLTKYSTVLHHPAAAEGAELAAAGMKR